MRRAAYERRRETKELVNNYPRLDEILLSFPSFWSAGPWSDYKYDQIEWIIEAIEGSKWGAKPTLELVDGKLHSLQHGSNFELRWDIQRKKYWINEKGAKKPWEK